MPFFKRLFMISGLNSAFRSPGYLLLRNVYQPAFPRQMRRMRQWLCIIQGPKWVTLILFPRLAYLANIRTLIHLQTIRRSP